LSITLNANAATAIHRKFPTVIDNMFQMSQPNKTDWDLVAQNPEFQALLKAKTRFIVPATLFFVVYYFALPLAVGYAKDFMSTPVLGPVNLAYLFALSQFFMAWTIAALYMRAAAKFDKMAQHILEQLEAGRKR
jgi:uncharacterized membrane protein (DUF485 family)